MSDTNLQNEKIVEMLYEQIPSGEREKIDIALIERLVKRLEAESLKGDGGSGLEVPIDRLISEYINND